MVKWKQLLVALKYNTHVMMNQPFFCINQDKKRDNEVYYICVKFPNLLILLTMIEGNTFTIVKLYFLQKKLPLQT